MIGTAHGQVRQAPPTVYQGGHPGRRGVASEYFLASNGQIGLELGFYDRTSPLVIDPVLTFSTYDGGGIVAGAAVALDPDGNVYVAGSNTACFRCGVERHVMKLDSAGRLGYRALFPADLSAIAVDSTGSAYLTGGTGSGFPTVGAFQAFGGGSTDASGLSANRRRTMTKGSSTSPADTVSRLHGRTLLPQSPFEAGSEADTLPVTA